MNDTQIATDSQVLNSDQTAAALGFSNFLMMQMLQAEQQAQGQPEGNQKSTEGQPQDASQTQESSPQQEQTPQPQEQPPQEEAPQGNKEIETLTKDFDEFKGKIEGIIETKFNDLTKTIKDAISND